MHSIRDLDHQIITLRKTFFLKTQIEKHEDYKIVNGLAHRCYSLLSSWDLFVLLLCLFFYLPTRPAIHSSIHPSILQILVCFVLCCCWARGCFHELTIWRLQRFDSFFSYLPEKQRRLYSLQLLSHVCPSSSFFFILVLSSPAFQRPEDNGAAHDAIVLPLSFVGGDLKFCFKTATSPILLNPPLVFLLLSPPFLLSILPNPSELQSELLKTRSTLGSQLHHWERNRDRQRLSCLLFYHSLR